MRLTQIIPVEELDAGQALDKGFGRTIPSGGLQPGAKSQLEASNEEFAELGRLVRGSKVPVRDRFRANIILRRLEGKSETEVAKELGCSLGAVCKWSKRFDAQGLTGL